MQSSQIWSGTMTPPFDPIQLPNCISRYARPGYSIVGNTGTYMDAVAGNNAVRTGTNPAPPASDGGAPVFQLVPADDYLEAPAGALAGIPGAGQDADHHFFTIFKAGPVFGPTHIIQPFGDDEGWLSVYIDHPSGQSANATLYFTEWKQSLNNYINASILLGPNSVVPNRRFAVQGKKTGGFIWLRLDGGAWVQSSVASGPLGIAALNALWLGLVNVGGMRVDAFVAYSRALSDADADKLDAWGATITP